MDELLELLAQRRGIGQEYTDIWGKRLRHQWRISGLSLMPWDMQQRNLRSYQKQISHEDLTYWQQMLDPVYVLRQQTAFHITSIACKCRSLCLMAY